MLGVEPLSLVMGILIPTGPHSSECFVVAIARVKSSAIVYRIWVENSRAGLRSLSPL